MTEHDRTIDGARGRGDPAGSDACFEELVGRRSVIPHGDRVDRAQSGGVEHEERPVLGAEENVVCIFVLHDDVDRLQDGMLLKGPAECFFQSGQSRCVPVGFERLVHSQRIQELCGAIPDRR